MLSNSFSTLSEKILKLSNDSIAVLTSLNKTVSSTEEQIQFTTTGANGENVIINLPTLSFLQSSISRLEQNLKSLSAVDSRGTIIQPSNNAYAKIIRVDLNREPNSIEDLPDITNFISIKNSFFDNILNPLLKIKLSLGDRIENNVREILSRKYILQFEVNSEGVSTPDGQSAIDLFNSRFKGRTDIEINELETWVLNTPGIVNGRNGRIDYDEESIKLEPNNLEFEGFYTILGTQEDIINKKLWYLIDTLDYYTVVDKTKNTLGLGNQLIVNTEFATTRYEIIEISKTSSEIRVRFENIEGSEPIPTAIRSGLKYYSPVIVNKTVNISVNFNEYNVVFLKAINTENYLLSRNFSKGVAFFTNDLTLISTDNRNINGVALDKYYIQSVYDFGELLKDLVNRLIPRKYGSIPLAPVLDANNFRVIQTNKHLTDTPDLAKNKESHQRASTLRSKLDELNKLIISKRAELSTRQFKNPREQNQVENQIKKLTEDANTTSTLLQSTTTTILANVNGLIASKPEYKVQGFWDLPTPINNGKTKPQEIVAFRIEYKYSSIQGQEAPTEIFKVTKNNGTITNAVFSPWTDYITSVRDRMYDVTTATWSWKPEDLSNIDEPNINSINLVLNPSERIQIRVKSISEVGYPDSLLESDWSNILTIDFPTQLLQGNNPQDFIIKSAELEGVRNTILSDLSSKGLDSHLRDSVIVDNKYYAHDSDNIGTKDSSNKLVSLSIRLKQLEAAESIEPLRNVTLITPWVNHGGGYGSARFYRNAGRVYLQGLIRTQESVDGGRGIRVPQFNNFAIRSNKNRVRTEVTNIGFLPEGYRPTQIVMLSSLCSALPNAQGDASYCRIDILPTGLILLVEGASAYVNLSGLSFRIA